MRVTDVRSALKSKLVLGDKVTDKSGVSVVELAPVHFLADEPAIFGQPDDGYIQREMVWYDSQSLNVNDIPEPVPTIWRQVADADGYINSNYGWCVYSKENSDQYDNVLAELRDQPSSRRAIMIYTRPSMWYEYDLNARSDFMCTNTVQYLIRGGRLIAHVSMRSNDAVYGYKNDWAWQCEVQRRLAVDLQIPVGDLYWTCGSLHVYERHWGLMV